MMQLFRRYQFLFLSVFSLLWPLSGSSNPSPAQKLSKALLQYQQLAHLNQWATFPKDLCLRPDDTLDFIQDLRKNLLLTGDLEQKENSANNIFDSALTMALKKFQRRHNLAPDGIVGQQTIEALNITPAQRVRQIQLNIKRWQADSALMVKPHVLVNIPDYTLQLIDKAYHTVWQTRVIVGQTLKGFNTTIMAGYITYLVINPSWHIPQSIILREIIPILKTDPAYLTRNHMALYRLNGSRRIKTSAEAINWFTFNAIKEPIQIVQEPGPWNALGNIKFIFPNENNIYLHDTPFKALFEQPVRTYSHGCIRVEHPHTLATYLLSTNWQNPVELTSIKQEKELNKIMPLPRPVPVKIGYYTCWVDADGDLQFRKDIYKLDNLKQNPPPKPSLPGPAVKVTTETKV